MKRGMQGASGTLKGAITLGESKTGQTVYVEPKFCVPMNNELMRLRSEEAKEETRVLMALTSKIRRGAEDIMGVYDQVVEVDTCFARAKHAAWIGGIRPEFAISPAGEDGDQVQVHVSVFGPTRFQRPLPLCLPLAAAAGVCL